MHKIGQLGGVLGRVFGSGTATLIISNEEMHYIMKIVKSVEESGLLIKDVSETIKNEAKERISQYVIRYIKRYFIRKPINR